MCWTQKNKIIAFDIFLIYIPFREYLARLIYQYYKSKGEVTRAVGGGLGARRGGIERR